MLNAYIVPLKNDVYNPYESEAKEAGHILFLQTTYGRVDIFKGYHFGDDNKLAQNRIGHMDFELNEESITQWCYAHFENCGKHPAIIKMNLETMQQELCMDKYIEDFVADNYDEIIRRLNENTK